MSASLRDAIAARRPVVAAGVYDGISARAAQEVGFDAYYIGSYATGATRYGVPDIGFIGLEDMADQVRRIRPLVDGPLIVDGEGGFGNPIHVGRTIAVLARAGASAVHIEDHDFGKHVTRSPRVLPLEQALDKITAAVAAKDSAEFMVIARTDAGGAHGDEEALRRAVAFQEAGADAVFMPGYGSGDDAAWSAARASLNVPIVDVSIPGRSAEDAHRLGTDVVLYYALTHLAALHGMRAAFAALAADRSATEVEATLPDTGAFDQFLGIEAAREAATRYRLLD